MNPMKTRRLGKTELALSRLGLGTWALGGAGWAFGWGAQDDDASVATILRAVAAGINWIDTAAVYGLGHSEEVIGRALSRVPRAERPYVFTKCGLVWNKKKIRHRLDPESIRNEAEASLRRLGAEAIDLYQIHWPDVDPKGPATGIEDGWATLSKLKEEGKVRHIGVSNFDVVQLERIGALADVSSLQPPYSLLRREIEAEILPYCLAREIGVIVYSPMESGLLTGTMTRERIAALPADDWRKSKSEAFREPGLSRNLERVEALRRVADRRQVSPGEVAIAWTLRHPAVTGAIVGARRPEQLDELLGAATLDLGDDDLRTLETVSPDVLS
jgi:aryl-alcohol dehydrogenase-like predicted oxidoreductase